MSELQLEELEERSRIFTLQDNVMVGLTSLPNPRLDRVSLYALPPWRAVMLARIAYGMQVMGRKERDNIVREARMTGGTGQLKPYALRTERELGYGVHAPWSPATP